MNTNKENILKQLIKPVLDIIKKISIEIQLGNDVEVGTIATIRQNIDRAKTINRNIFTKELRQIILLPKPSVGFIQLDKIGLLPLVLPELANLKGVETVNGRGHKEIFEHTMQVLDNVATQSDNEWLRWAALLHDIGKPATKHWDVKQGWTFHNHNYVGMKMVKPIFKKMGMPSDEHMEYVKKLVELHMRPIALVEDEVTDSAVRRMLTEAGDDVDDLMILCRADITSKNQEKVKRFRENYELVKQKTELIKKKDHDRNLQPQIDGKEIMDTFGLDPSPLIGNIKDPIKKAILDGVIGNDYGQVYSLMMKKAEELGIEPVNKGKLNYIIIDTVIGKISIASTIKGILAVEFGEMDFSALAAKIKLEPCNTSTPLLDNCVKQLNEYFEGNRREFSLPLHLVGTEFQMKVWKTLMTIPYGTTISYKEEAIRMGNDKALRAVAQANGANPIPIIIPCHRVINSDGTPGGYSSGLDKKLFLLKLEKTVCQT
ncbi:MAG: methylated-DNA--[Muribaculaceae bacterium]|nr:methylated-DNA--[protein]-cysteine S-methyltransferase [Muribaculaceae bacterium]